jgi:hypothetical protein
MAEPAPFTTPVTITGPPRLPRQLLDDQTYDGHASLHDEATAGGLGLSGAPIEGPTHFSQFDPLAVRCWGPMWFETGCISAHFSTMVVEGEEVTAGLSMTNATSGRIEAVKADGSVVLTGTASIDPADETALDARLARSKDPGELFIVDQLTIGQRSTPVTTSVDAETPNGALYPFSLARKLDAITEPSDWYRSGDNPWGRPILPFEMISVLAAKAGGGGFAVRGPAIGLFLDLEIRVHGEPVFVGQEYRSEREVIGLGQSRRTESYWTRTSLTDPATGDLRATVVLHSGVFKESYAGYPADRL